MWRTEASGWWMLGMKVSSGVGGDGGAESVSWWSGARGASGDGGEGGADRASRGLEAGEEAAEGEVFTHRCYF